MKTNKISAILVAAATVAMVGCSSMSSTGKGALIGTGGGAALGAGIGAIFGGEKGAAIGAGIGAGVGAGAGALIGKKMDKQAEELAKIEGSKVETITDVNGLTAIKVTFEGGILFATNKSILNETSKQSLASFAKSLQTTPDTDVTVYGHTDNTGSLEVNEKLSQARAESVAKYLKTQGVDAKRLIAVKGMAYNQPVADNTTAEGRAANRRVEIYISANEQMIQAAQSGNLK